MLCIGGPRDGKRYHVLHGNGFRVAVTEPVSYLDDYRYGGEACTKVEFTDYHAELFRTPQGDVEFWVPVGQTPLETITRLLESYEARRWSLRQKRCAEMPTY